VSGVLSKQVRPEQALFITDLVIHRAVKKFSLIIPVTGKMKRAVCALTPYYTSHRGKEQPSTFAALSSTQMVDKADRNVPGVVLSGRRAWAPGLCMVFPPQC